MDKIKVTSEVESTSQIMYVIRIDEELLGYNCSLESCVSIIDSIAARETSRLSNEWTKILREDLKGGQKVVLLKQDIGRIYNGSPVPIMTIDVQKIPHLNLIRHRFSEELSEIPPPPPLPSLEKLSEKAKEKYSISLAENLPECYLNDSSEEYSEEYSEEHSEEYSEEHSEEHSEEYSEEYSEKYPGKFSDYLSEDSSEEYSEECSEEYSSSSEESSEECFEMY